MRKGSFDFTNLVCLECGYIFTIPRRTYKLKNNGHIKDCGVLDVKMLINIMK